MFIKIVVKLVACSALASCFLWLCALPSFAQPATPPANPDAADQTTSQPQAQDKPSSTPASQTPADKDESSQNQSSQNQSSQSTSSSGQTSGEKSGTSGTSKDRLFFALPNFLTLESAGHLPPLTAKQKFAVVARGSFDYIQIPWYAFLSGINQAENSEPGLGQGWGGYGKRFATSFADGTIENFMVGAVFPTVLRQDPRYYQLGKGGFWHRTFYAVSRNLITLSDSGKKQFNYSEVVGGATSAAISTYSYHPKGTSPESLHFIHSDRTLANTATVWVTQYGYDTMTLVIKEFWPDIRRALNRKGVHAPGQ